MNLADLFSIFAAGPFGEVRVDGPLTGDPVAGLSQLIVFGVRSLIFVAGLALLAYLLWGAFDWINSGGEADKLTEARSKMTHAVLGMILIFVALAVFVLVGDNMLGIIDRNAEGDIIFKLPTLQNNGTTDGKCTYTDDPDC